MSRRTVIVRATPNDPMRFEMPADAALRPGQLVQYASGGTSIEVLSATIDPQIRVVLDYGDKPLSGTYAAGDMVPFIAPRSGDQVVLCVYAAALATLAATNKVVAGGAGYAVYAAAPAVGEAFAEVMETGTISAQGVTQIICEVL